jgi:hypothetical protein
MSAHHPWLPRKRMQREHPTSHPRRCWRRLAPLWVTMAFVVSFPCATGVLGQFPPDNGKGSKDKGGKGGRSEEEEIARALRKAYEPPQEREGKILNELRKAEYAPSSEREDKILREIRKRYQTTPEDEARIVAEIRKAYQAPSTEQEARIFQVIQQVPPIPPGVLPPDSKRGEGLFRQLDQNGDGVLNTDEMPEGLKAEREKWDANHDGVIDLMEFQAYFQSRVQRALLENQNNPTNGRGGQGSPDPQEEKYSPPVVYHAGKLPKGLPSWFQQLDADNDGQVGLYEWKLSGRPIEEFLAMDRNDDGFLTAEEVLRYVAHAQDRSERGLGAQASLDASLRTRTTVQANYGPASKLDKKGWADRPKKDKRARAPDGR